MKFRWTPGGKTRRHHNNDGRRQIQNGKTRQWVERIRRLWNLPPSPSFPKDHERDT